MKQLNEFNKLILLVLYVADGKLDWEKIKFAVYILNKILNEDMEVV